MVCGRAQSARASDDAHLASMSHLEQEQHWLCHVASTPYDPSNPEHFDLLRELWVSSGLGPAGTFEPVSELWLSIGFQGPEPSMDLRGAGILGLRQLVHYFLSAHGAPRRCPIAGASLNVTLLLCRHFRLQLSYGDLPLCSNRVQYELVRLAHAHRLQGIPCILDLLHAALLRALADRWHEIECTPLHFPALLRESGAHLQHALTELEGPWNTASVLCALVAKTRGCATDAACYSCPRLSALGCMGWVAPSDGMARYGAMARGLCELASAGHA